MSGAAFGPSGAARRSDANQGGVVGAQMLELTDPAALKTRVVGASEMADSVGYMISRTFDHKVALELDTSSQCSVLVDEPSLRASLLSLALNARDAMPGGGQVKISTSDIALEGESYVQFAVTDTGPGIADDVRDRVTEPFFSTKPAGTATGLGLTAVKAFVERSHGRLKLRSTPEGTTVAIQLPAVPNEESLPLVISPVDDVAVVAPEQVTTGQATTGQPVRVLIVDDEPLLALVLKELLQELGAVATTCEGIDGLVVDDLGGHDLVVTDVVLGDHTGIDVWHEIRKHNVDVPIAFMSGQIPDEYRGIICDLEPFAILNKHFGLSRLAELLEDYRQQYEPLRADHPDPAGA